MVNTNEVTTRFCEENELPVASNKDLSSIGFHIRNAFNFKNINNKGFRGHIEGTGLMRIKEDGKAIVVIGYPDAFEDKMKEIVGSFFEQKKKRMDDAEAERQRSAEVSLKPKRPRIPANRPLNYRK